MRMYPSRQSTRGGSHGRGRICAGHDGGELGERRLGHHRTPSRRPSRSARCSRRRSSSASCLASRSTGAGVQHGAGRARRRSRRAGDRVRASSLFARQYQGAGAVYEYLTHGAHIPRSASSPRASSSSAPCSWAAAASTSASASSPTGFWAEHIDDVDTCRPGGCSSLLVPGVGRSSLNYLGVRIAIGAMLTFAATLVHPDADPGARDHRPGRRNGNTLRCLQPRAPRRSSTVFNGVMLGILLFVGFEAAASLGEESHDPARSIPRALLGTVGASAAVLRDHGLRDLDRARQDGCRQGRMARSGRARTTWPPSTSASWFATIIDLVVILDATAWRWRSASPSGAATSRSAATACCRRSSPRPRGTTRRGWATWWSWSAAAA